LLVEVAETHKKVLPFLDWVVQVVVVVVAVVLVILVVFPSRWV
jgi:hypothetical protein